MHLLTRNALATAPVESVAALDAERISLRAAAQAYDRQIAYLSDTPFYRVVNDLLSENGSVTFHRLQIFVWTIVLGIIFCVNVYGDLSMPEFSGTLLGLMGISAGTYVGFKLPPERA